jgi:hypothetical protein
MEGVGLFRLGALLITVCVVLPTQALITDEAEAARWLAQYNEESQIVYSKYMEAHWTYNTNLTDYNQQLTVSISICYI